MDRLVVSVDEAAVALGISRSLAYELVHRQELPALRFGRRIVIPREAVERLVAEVASCDAAPIVELRRPASIRRLSPTS